jgi:RND superfamily putative drug exporter
MATVLHRLGLTSARHRIVVTLIWLFVFVGAGIGAATLSGPTVNTFRIPGQESTTALDLMGQRFGKAAAGANAQVVIEVPEGTKVTDPEQAAKVAGVVATFAKLPGVGGATNPLDPEAPAVSPDLRAALTTVLYPVTAQEITEAQHEAFDRALEQARNGDLTVEARGEALTRQVDVGGPAEFIGVIAALVVLAITYGALVAAGMNLLTAVVGVGIGALGLTAATGFLDLQSTTPVLAVMLGLAVGIDYALFIVTRFRHELLIGREVPDAAAVAVGTAGSAVVTAGLSVVIALAGLAVAGIPFLTEMGLAAAGTVVIAVLVAITLVPATLAMIGLKALPRKARTALREGAPGPADPLDVHGRGFYRRWVHALVRFRWPSLVAAVIVLAIVALPVLWMRTSLAQPPATGSTEARAEAILTSRFGPGVTGPLVILVDGPNAKAAAAGIRAEAAAVPGVAAAAAPTFDPAGTAAQSPVIPKSGPESAETTALVHALRDDIADRDGAKVYVTGQTAVSIDVSQKLDAALPLYLALVVGLAFVLLVLVFRSVLVPVTGVLGFLLTIGATLGATTAVFQWGWLSEAVNADAKGPMMSLAPIIIVGILFGLAMDYQVFLVSRMHEAHAHGAGPRDAIVSGFRHAAPVVVAAATIMFAVFAGFVPQGDATIKPIAFALALGILFDALVIRMVAVPAALALLGRAAWWLPRWLRRLPELDVEGAALERKVPAPRPAREPAGARR